MLPTQYPAQTSGFFLWLLITCLNLPIPLATADPPEPATRPNVLLIYTDDQGFGDASCLNPEAKFQTPNLDRLARQGMAFLDAHCSDTVCTPSRYGLLTGRYAWRTTLKRGVMGAEGKCLIADGRMTLATLLRDQGYRTAMVGKWHLGMDFPGTGPENRDWSQPVQDMPLDKGFDYFFGVPASLNYGVLAWFEGRHAKVPPTVFTNKKPNKRHVDYRIKPPYQTTPSETKELLGRQGMEVAPDFVDNQCLTRFTEQAISWLSEHQAEHEDAPFFLYLPLTSPHYPVCPLPEFHGQGAAGGYGEFMIETDARVGQILDFLKEADLSDNTLVIFTSDNGPEKSWAQRVKDFDHRSNGVYREGKRSIYEGGHRVPFLVRWPAGIANSGTTSNATICQTDVLATIAEILEVDLPEDAGEDSYSFLGELTGTTVDAEPATSRPPIIHHSSSGGFAIRQGPWKLVMPAKKGQKRELYQLERDPSEKQNVLAQWPAEAKQLESELNRIILSGRSTLGMPQPNDTGHWAELHWISPSEYSASAVD